MGMIFNIATSGKSDLIWRKDIHGRFTDYQFSVAEKRQTLL